MTSEFSLPWLSRLISEVLISMAELKSGRDEDFIRFKSSSCTNFFRHLWHVKSLYLFSWLVFSSFLSNDLEDFGKQTRTLVTLLLRSIDCQFCKSYKFYEVSCHDRSPFTFSIYSSSQATTWCSKPWFWYNQLAWNLSLAQRHCMFINKETVHTQSHKTV